MCLNKKNFLFVAGILFLVIFVLHLNRLVMGLPASIGGFAVPNWLSLIAILVSAFLSYNAFYLMKKK